MTTLSRRKFLKTAAAGGTAALGLAGLDGFARLAEAIAGRARPGPRPGGGSGEIRPLDWTCPSQYCVKDGAVDCTAAYSCYGEVHCGHPPPAGFECFGPDAYGCYEDRTFVCEVHFLCKDTEGGRFNCSDGAHEHYFYCWVQFSCSPPAVFCDAYPFAEPEPEPPEPTP